MLSLPGKLFFRIILVFTASSMSIAAAQAYAKNKTNSHKVDIQARYLLLDDNQGISTYEGNVVFTKGTLVIKADTMTLYYDGEKLSKVLILGSPADVRHQPDNEAQVHSQAKKMEYLLAEDKLTLTGQAFVTQGSRHFSGETIEYDTRQRIVSASGNPPASNVETAQDAATNSRVHVIIGSDSQNSNETSNGNVSPQ